MPPPSDLTLLQVQAAFGEPGVLCVRTEVRGSCTASWVSAGMDSVVRVVVREDMVTAVTALLAEHLLAKEAA